MRARILTGAMIAALVLMAIACGTNNVGTLSDPQHGASGFSLNVLTNDPIPGSSAQSYNITTEDYGQDVVVHVNAVGAQSLKGIYFDMTYDPAHYRPMIVDPAKAMGSRSDLICLQIFKDRGTVHYGQILTNWEWRTGFTGDATVASVLFKKMPTIAVRNVSTPPSDANSAPNLVFNGTDTLTWYYYNTGDYSQDFQVAVSDIAVLGAHWNDAPVAPAFYPEDTIQSVVDGKRDGGINIGDLTPIGANFGKTMLGGYNVYHSALSTDYPTVPPYTPVAVDAAHLLGNVARTAATGNKATNRLAFSYTIVAPVANDYYWVRPNDGATTPMDGTPSTLAGGPPAAVTLVLITPAISGTGTVADPYQVNITTDYGLQVLDAASADITDSASFTDVDNAVAFTGEGSVTVTFNVDDTFVGPTFSITATVGPDSDTLFFTLGGAPGADVDIWPDPADTDWAAVTGTGTDVDPYVIPEVVAPGVYPDYTMQADDLAAVGADHSAGNPIALNLLTWDAFPPFIVTWTADGVFQPNAFTSEYVFARLTSDDTPSNNAFVEVHALP
jgi:hypothetical protein